MGVLTLALLGVSVALVCPDGGLCEDKDTCCKNNQGSYSCCPLPHAVCCSDHRHCCYEGTICDLSHQKCVNKTISLPWISRLPTRRSLSTLQLPGRLTAIMCPGHEFQCPSDTTCCQLPSGAWGCCPLPKAVCCEDKAHCCPQGTTCDLIRLKCVSPSLGSFPLLQKIPARPSKNRAASVVSVTCPDGESSCPDTYTCCLLPSGDYGCCPYENATCCSDHLHCCPSNTTCDLKQRICRPGGNALQLRRRISSDNAPLSPRRGHAVPCNDSVACAKGSTCCRSPKGEWACCPLPQAVCCKDHRHCCPHGTVCNLVARSCDDPAGNAITPLLPNTAVFPLGTDNTKCDESVSCPGHATCCRAMSGAWACCPLPQAVCCKDHIHCCPHGSICNLTAETCDDSVGLRSSLPWFSKLPAVASKEQFEKCDEQFRCPEGSTCCRRDSGAWACCPSPQAVCCSDREHCCPRGYTCNSTRRACDKAGSLGLPWFQKQPVLVTAGQRRPNKNMCDAQTSCPTDTTCCFMERSRSWGCCPVPKAVCCKDGTHCCPSGHTCEPHRSSCSRGLQVVPWFTKLSAHMELSALTDIKCDNKSSCASGTTCCKLPSGEWGCCPLVKAVCCTDHKHCCPQGYNCNMQTGTCEKKAGGVLLGSPPLIPVAQPQLTEEEEDKLPCDSVGGVYCSKKETCCKISSTEWSCCPAPQAQCCSDSKHCCPTGYSCDLQAAGCSLQSRLTWDSLLGHRTRHFVVFKSTGDKLQP